MVKVKVIDVYSNAVRFEGTLAQAEAFIDKWGFRIVADNDAGTSLWVA